MNKRTSLFSFLIPIILLTIDNVKGGRRESWQEMNWVYNNEAYFEKESNNFLAKFLITDHLLNDLFVILAFNKINGNFFSLILSIKFGQISESTKDTKSGFQFLKKFSIKGSKS